MKVKPEWHAGRQGDGACTLFSFFFFLLSRWPIPLTELPRLVTTFCGHSQAAPYATKKLCAKLLFRASSRGLRAVWLCNNKFASKGGFLAAQKEDAWQFSTSTFWSLSVQSFIALESRLLISPLFFLCTPLPVALLQPAHSQKFEPTPSLVLQTFEVYSLDPENSPTVSNGCSDVIAVSVLKQLRWRGALYVQCYLSLRSCFFRVALCMAELFSKAILLFVLVCKSCSYVIYFPPYVCKRLQIVQMLGAACTVI